MEYGELPLKFKSGQLVLPTVTQFKKMAKIGSQLPEGWSVSVNVPGRHDERAALIADVHDWFEDTNCDTERYTLFGVYGIDTKPYRVDRLFCGVTVYFVDFTDAISLRLCMADRCFG